MIRVFVGLIRLFGTCVLIRVSIRILWWINRFWSFVFLRRVVRWIICWFKLINFINVICVIKRFLFLMRLLNIYVKIRIRTFLF